MEVWVVTGCVVLAYVLHLTFPFLTLVGRGIYVATQMAANGPSEDRDSDGWAQYISAPDDIIVAVPSKSGTTAVLHMCHQLRYVCNTGLIPPFSRSFLVQESSYIMLVHYR